MNLKNMSPLEHVVQSQQFDKEFLLELFEFTDFMKKNEYYVSDMLEGKTIAMLFYEPSTRTRFSFESAATRLGANKITTENAKEFSSASKGETLQDTIKVMDSYVDFIVMRHFQDDASDIAATISTKPIINAGSGKAQHPTQALLDMYTIYNEIGRLDKLDIMMVGDLLRGRTVESLVYLLSKFDGNEFCFISPDNSKVKPGIKKHQEEHNIRYKESENLEKYLSRADVVYMTRIQKERFDDPKEYEKAKGNYILDMNNVPNMKESSIIMHPLPRVDEIDASVDNNHRAKYFKQAQNGLYVRMALLAMLNKNKLNSWLKIKTNVKRHLKI
jgi:aspartate carbamoyltransferase catalytic subunit